MVSIVIPMTREERAAIAALVARRGKHTRSEVLRQILFSECEREGVAVEAKDRRPYERRVVVS